MLTRLILVFYLSENCTTPLYTLLFLYDFTIHVNKNPYAPPEINRLTSAHPRPSDLDLIEEIAKILRGLVGNSRLLLLTLTTTLTELRDLQEFSVFEFLR